MRTTAALAATVLLLGAACGKKQEAGGKAAGAAAAGAGAAAAKDIPPKPLGFETIAALGYPWGKGARDHKRAQEAHKAGDWAGVQTACEAALAQDPGHLEAHRLLASALAAQARPEQVDAVGEHLSIALATDLVRFGGGLAEDPELARYLASPAGDKLRALAAKYREDFAERAKKGVLLVGRRAPFKGPDKPGVQAVTTRAELYAYDPEANRYLRLTQTGQTLAGWLPSSAGDEIAYVAYAKVKWPTPEEEKAGTPPSLVDPRVGLVRPGDPAGAREAKLRGSFRGVGLTWQAGDQLFALTFEPAGRWGLGAQTTWIVDPATGESKRTRDAPAEGTRLVVTYDAAELVRSDAPGVEADFGGESGGAASLQLSASKKVVTLPSGELALRDTLAFSPSGARLAFATWIDACAKRPVDRQASIYTVEAATGKLKHVFRGEGVAGLRWLDDDRLVYEDDRQGLRLYDAAPARELVRLSVKGGLALAGLGAAAGQPLCKKEAWDYEAEADGARGGEGEPPEGWEGEPVE